MEKLGLQSESPTFPTSLSPTAGLEEEVNLDTQGAVSMPEPSGEADSDNSCKV